MREQSKKLIEDTICYIGIYGIIMLYIWHMFYLCKEVTMNTEHKPGMPILFPVNSNELFSKVQPRKFIEIPDKSNFVWQGQVYRKCICNYNSDTLPYNCYCLDNDCSAYFTDDDLVKPCKVKIVVEP